MIRSFVGGMAVLLLTPIPIATAQDRAAGAGILDDRIDTLLRQWGERAAEVKSFHCAFTRITEDKVWRTKERAKGKVWYLHPKRARLDVLGENAQSVVLDGAGDIWVYDPAKKQINIFKGRPHAAEDPLRDGPLPFLFERDPRKARHRYRLELLGEDETIIRLRVYPKLNKDKATFVRAELWLEKKRFLPTKLVFVEPNRNEVTYLFEGIRDNLRLDPDKFVGKRWKGWKVVVQRIDENDGAARRRQVPQSRPRLERNAASGARSVSPDSTRAQPTESFRRKRR